MGSPRWRRCAKSTASGRRSTVPLPAQEGRWWSWPTHRITTNKDIETAPQILAPELKRACCRARYPGTLLPLSKQDENRSCQLLAASALAGFHQESITPAATPMNTVKIILTLPLHYLSAFLYLSIFSSTYVSWHKTGKGERW